MFWSTVTNPVTILVSVTVVGWCSVATTAAAGPITDIFGNIVNNFACRLTANNGRTGQCLPRTCCRNDLAVEKLCATTGYTCCYGSDLCLDRDVYPNNRPLTDYPSRLDRDRYYPNEDRSCNSYISRHDWEALPTRNQINRMSASIKSVIVHHTGDNELCYSFNECRRLLQQIQRHYQQNKNFPDIPWNFLIADNGDIFEGMGWRYEGYHTEDWNYRSFGVAFIGSFDEIRPSRRALDAFDSLLDCGVRHGYLNRYYRLYAHRDMRDTDCPGDLLYDLIRDMKSYERFDMIKVKSAGPVEEEEAAETEVSTTATLTGNNGTDNANKTNGSRYDQIQYSDSKLRTMLMLNKTTN